MTMGLSETESRLGLRAANGSPDQAVTHVMKNEKVNADTYTMLLSMGFKRGASREALRQANNNLSAALEGRKLHIRIAQMLDYQITDNYLKYMKRHSRLYLEPAILCGCTSPSDIFDELETKGHIRIGNYEILKELLNEAGLVNVLNMVEEMEKDILSYTKPATSYEFEIVQTVLKTWYSNNMKCIQPLPMCEWEEQDLEHIFTNLQVVEGKKSRPNDSFTEKSTNDPKIIDRIFEVNPPVRNICFIEGPAGIGKSTLCRQFAYLWSKDAYKIHGHHFDLVGILEARSLTKDFRKSFVQELFPWYFQIPEENIYQLFETRKSLLIIDGVDELTADGEWVITQLLKGKFFRNVHLIITGRPEPVRKFLRSAKLHLEVKGFSVRNVEEYICKYFRNDENNYEKMLLNRLRHDRKLRELMVNPFVTVLLCILVQEKSGDIPLNRREIYHEVMWAICRKYVRKLQEQRDCSLDEERLYNAACYLAYTGVRDNVFVFPENDINSLCEGDLGFHLVKSGILSKDYTISRLHSNEFCYFPHRSFQEFLCGTYLKKLDLDEFKKEVLPLLRFSPTLPLKSSVLECIRYFLSTQVDKTKIVLERMFAIIARDKTKSIEICLDRISQLLNCVGSINPRLDLVDFFKMHFNRSFKVAQVFLKAVDLNVISDPLNDQTQLAICKMDLPPVANVMDEDKLDIGYISPELIAFLAMDTSVTVRSVHSYRKSRLLKHFTKLNGVKMPFIHCNDIKRASTCLKKLRRLGVLAITLPPHRLHYTDLQAFQNDLTSVENKINIVFVFLEARYDDSRFPHFISLVKGYSSDKVKIQVIRLKPVDTEEENTGYRFRLIAYIRRYDYKVTDYRLQRPLHQECYDRFCPY